MTEWQNWLEKNLNVKFDARIKTGLVKWKN